MSHELLIHRNGTVITYSEALLIQEQLQALVAQSRAERKDKYGAHPPEPVVPFSRENVTLQADGSLGLQIQLNGTDITLPIITVGSDENQASIAILNPLVPEIAEHGSTVLAQHLTKLGVEVVITAPSSKSEAMVDAATQKAEIQPPLILLGGSENRQGQKHIFTEYEVLALHGDERVFTQACRPITLAPDQPSKFLGISDTLLTELIPALGAGKRIAIVDDVYSSGATITAIQELLRTACASKGVRLPELNIVVVAQELPEDHEFFTDPDALTEHNLKNNLTASILLPVLKNN